ncbi:hypothetical protein H312_00109 [Anncaliia algerae PRA339]|uniref:Uncharacterized protein n=1 Tax=Anncaliia algerae PRA339 TaxID=1288291 RepID=A0A059F642_9MICR|nr:hypothetical protein H312_00109 [Anncaliia algerae PRA339]
MGLSEELINSFNKIEKERIKYLNESLNKIKVPEEAIKRLEKINLSLLFNKQFKKIEESKKIPHNFINDKETEKLIENININKVFDNVVGSELKSPLVNYVPDLIQKNSFENKQITPTNNVESILEGKERALEKNNDYPGLSSKNKEENKSTFYNAIEKTEYEASSLIFSPNLELKSDTEVKEMIIDFLNTPLNELKIKKCSDILYTNVYNIPLANEFVFYLANDEKNLKTEVEYDKKQALEFKKYLTKRISQMTSEKEHMDNICESIKLENTLQKEVLASKLVELGVTDVNLRPKTSNIYSYVLCKLYDKELYLLFRSKLLKSNANGILGAYSIYFNVLNIKKKYKESLFFIYSVISMVPNSLSGEVVVLFLNLCNDLIRNKNEFINVLKFIKEVYLNEIVEEPTKIRINLELEKYNL